MNRRYRLERAAPYRPAHPRAGPHADLRENQLSLPVLAALCDIFDVTPAAADRHPRREHPGPPPRRQRRRRQPVTDLNALRPARATAPARAVSRAPKKRTCARCGHHGFPAASFPEGHLCRPCLNAALAVTGTCPGCGTKDRVLPGLRDGTAICRDCARITRHFSCLRCGTETGMAAAAGRRLCGPCAVTWAAARLLDDGTGRHQPAP